MKHNNVCCVYTIYPLFLYLINAEDEEIDSTTYILDSSIPKGYEARLKNCWRYSVPNKLTDKWWIDWIILRWHIFRNLPRLHKKTKLFMQDHKPWTAVYAGNHKYTYLEDSPLHISYIWDPNQSNWYTDIMKWDRLKICQFLYGSSYYESFAHHPNATSLLLTEDDPAPFLKGRKRIFSSLLTNETWKSFSDFKQKRILEIFDVSEQDIVFFRNADTMLITQPLWPDSVSKEVHADIYKKLLAFYDESKVIIKTHPRETLNYKELFPKAKVFAKPLPIQLLAMLGINIKTVVTIYSTAVMQFPKNIAVHWYGTEFDNRLFEKVGHFPTPQDIQQISL